MTVYIDSANIRYGRMIMCHMVADAPLELHKMAADIGVKRKWYQHKASTPHYDICQAKVRAALRRGAKLVDNYELVLTLRRIRAQCAADPVLRAEWRTP